MLACSILGRILRVGVLMAAATVSATPGVLAEQFTYTAASGTQTMSGTVGSLSFTNATWVMQATADPANVVSGTIEFAGSLHPIYFVPASVSLSITDSVNGVTTMSVNNPPGQSWGVFSVSYNALIPGASGLGFGAYNTGTSPWGYDPDTPEFGLVNGGSFGGTPGAYNNLGSAGTWLGGEVAPGVLSETLSTSLGIMTRSAISSGANTGSFVIVPEPSTNAMALVGLASGGYSMWRRRKRA